jgi:hypothetical protein
MTRLVIGALLVLAAQTGWAFNGCPPASDDADKCERGIVKALGKFGGAVIKCHAKQADGAFKQKPVDEETCEETGSKSAKGKFDATVAKTAPKCPPEVVANAGTVSAGLVSGSGSLDVQNGLVYCDTSSGTPIDPSGDDAGSVPSSADGLKCSDGVGKDLAKLWGAIGKCSTEAADAAFKGKAFDEATCRSTATGKYDAAAAKLIAKGGCPTCLDAGAQSALRDALLTQLDAIDGQIFVCPAPTTTTTTVTLPTTTTTTSLPGSTTTTSTTTTTLATTTTTSASSTSTTSTAPSTTTTSTSAPPTTTSSSTTTSSAAPTTTTSTTTPVTTSTTTTMPSLSACPAGGQVDVITNLVPDIDTFSSGQVGGIEVDVGYPASVSMPGTQFLPVNDPNDPATLIVLLSRTPPGINLYDGIQTFFDADSAAPFTLRTVLTLNLTSNLIFNQTVPFERARFTCTPGAALSATSFPCTIPQEVNSIGGTVPVGARPPCVITLAAPS